VSDVVENRVQSGRRVAELLASELEGREDGPFAPLAVTDADRDVEPSLDGTRAYDISHQGEEIGRVYLHEERARLELSSGLAAARERLAETEIRSRVIDGDRPRLLVFIPDGVTVKRVLPAIGAAAGSRTAD
jgi:hypothetical protein